MWASVDDKHSKSEELSAAFVKTKYISTALCISITSMQNKIKQKQAATQVTSFQIQCKTNSACTVTFQAQTSQSTAPRWPRQTAAAQPAETANTFCSNIFLFFFPPHDCIKTKQQRQASLFCFVCRKHEK